MSKMARDKGARIEREIVAAHGALGVKAERVPLSGASRYQGNGSDPNPKAYGSLFAGSRGTAFETDNGRSVLAAGTGLHAPFQTLGLVLPGSVSL
jgi:hypothetical protein